MFLMFSIHYSFIFFSVVSLHYLSLVYPINLIFGIYLGQTIRLYARKIDEVNVKETCESHSEGKNRLLAEKNKSEKHNIRSIGRDNH